jgi:hypothetical protein
MSKSRTNGEDIMVVQCPVRHLGIVRRDRSCMLEPWATIQRILGGQTPLVFWTAKTRAQKTDGFDGSGVIPGLGDKEVGKPDGVHNPDHFICCESTQCKQKRCQFAYYKTKYRGLRSAKL